MLPFLLLTYVVHTYAGKSSPTAKTAKTGNGHRTSGSPDMKGCEEKEDQDLQQLIEESDNIIKELNRLFPTSSGPMSVLFGNVLKSGLDVLKRKRGSGKRDPNEIYKELNPQVQGVEKDLRERLAAITERKSALKDQAKHLISRLDACILYNVERSQIADNFTRDCQRTLSSLNKEFLNVIQMLDFNQELTVQSGSGGDGGSFAVSGRKNFSAWTYVFHKMKERGSNQNIDLNNSVGDSDENFLRYRHERCKKCIEEYENSLCKAQEIKYNFSTNLDNCSDIRLQLVTIIRENENPGSPDSRLSSPTFDVIHGNGVDDILDESVNGNIYDHSNCHDCMYTYNISKDCAEWLRTLDKQEESISERLLTLIELREGLKGILGQHSLLQTKDASLFISSLPISIPSDRAGEELELPIKQLQRDIERDVIIINGKKILGAVGIELVLNEIVVTVDEVFSQNSNRILYREPSNESKTDFAMGCLRRAARTNSGGNSFQALQSLVDLMEIEIQPQSSLASPLEIEINVGSCAKYILDSSSDEIQQFSDVDAVGLMAKIQTSTNYLLMKSQEKVKARTLSVDTGFASIESDGIMLMNDCSNEHQKLERRSSSSIDGAVADTALAVAAMNLEGKADDKMETSEEDAVDKFCDLTAIYENQVFVILDKKEDSESPAKKKWFSPLRSKIVGSQDQRQQAPIRTGYGNVLIDQRR